MGYGVEPGRAQRDRLEERGLYFFEKAERAERLRIIPLQEQKQDKAGKDQARRDRQRNFGVQRKAVHPPPQRVPRAVADKPVQLPADGEADAAHDNQSHNGEIDQRIPDKRGQALTAYVVEPGVAESGNGVEKALPERFPQPHIRGYEKRGGQQDHARELRDERDEQYAADEPDHPARALLVERGLDHKPVLQGDSAVEREHADGNHRHVPQPAELDQDQNHNLAEHGPALHGVEHNQARHTVCRRRGEQRVKKADALAAAAGKGQGEQDRADEDHQGEARHDRLRRREVDFCDQPQVFLHF